MLLPLSALGDAFDGGPRIFKGREFDARTGATPNAENSNCGTCRSSCACPAKVAVLADRSVEDGGVMVSNRNWSAIGRHHYIESSRFYFTCASMLWFAVANQSTWMPCIALIHQACVLDIREEIYEQRMVAEIKLIGARPRERHLHSMI